MLDFLGTLLFVAMLLLWLGDQPYLAAACLVAALFAALGLAWRWRWRL
jgi:hypothetical protein